MEVISCHAAHCSHIIKLRGSKDLSSHHAKFHSTRGNRLFLVFESDSLSSRHFGMSKRFRERQTSQMICSLNSYEQFGSSSTSETSRTCVRHFGMSKRFRERQTSQMIYSLNSYEQVGSSSTSETSRTCVLDGEGSGSSVTDGAHSIPKVSIPGLPDEENGDNLASISSFSWEWKPNLTVHYETSGSQNINSPAILFLPGFGVGSFHYKKQLKDLGRDYRTWALDFLGQGMSLPCEDPTLLSNGGNKNKLDRETDVWGFGDESEVWAQELVFSVDLWQEQVRYFVEEVIKEPVYIVGNSLGGFMALYFAAFNPELVKGVTLLNATPFWGFIPNPERSPRLSRLFPWAGTFPLPSNVKMLIEILWQKISDPRSIAEILKQVYADHSTKVDDVFSRIVETTQHPAAAASFASIMFAPQGRLTFDEALSRCRINNIPLCLMYGKQDPWVTPIWGLQVKRKVRSAPYYEMSPAGHCPHDEVPEVVNFLLRGWIQNLESKGSIAALPLLDTLENTEYGVTKDLEFTRKGTRKSIRVQFHGSKYSIWDWLSYHFKSLFKYRTL